MQNYNIIIKVDAQEDLTNINDYISTVLFAPSAANALLDKIEAVFSSLRSFPEMGTLLKTEIQTKFVYRWIKVDNYLIFYTVDSTTETVHIMRVLFGASNYLNVLK